MFKLVKIHNFNNSSQVVSIGPMVAAMLQTKSYGFLTCQVLKLHPYTLMSCYKYIACLLRYMLLSRVTHF